MNAYQANNDYLLPRSNKTAAYTLPGQSHKFKPPVVALALLLGLSTALNAQQDPEKMTARRVHDTNAHVLTALNVLPVPSSRNSTLTFLVIPTLVIPTSCIRAARG